MPRPTSVATAAAAALLLGSCTTAYYRVLETVGIEKRDILVDRVEDARDAQTEAKEQFASALDRYRAVVAIEGGDLEQVYDRLDSEYERSVSRAEDVRERIGEVETVAEDLFVEWEDELDEYADPELRGRSQRLLARTQNEYESLMRAMRRAESAMEPVLVLFNDQVLILRHNLNARAIGALETELDTIERATSELIEEMERAIAEAGRFVDAIG